MSQTRTAAGTPIGGRFAPTPHPEATLTLAALEDFERRQAVETQRTSPCPACEHGLTADLGICLDCDGSGLVTDHSRTG